MHVKIGVATSESEERSRVVIVFEIGVPPPCVDRGAELLVVLSVSVRGIFLALDVAKSFGGDFVENGDCGFWARFWGKVMGFPRSSWGRKRNCS